MQLTKIKTLSELPEDGLWYEWEPEMILVRRVPGTVIGVSRNFIFTTAILRGVDETGYSERWCYHTFHEALGWATTMDATSEPENYIRRLPHV